MISVSSKRSSGYELEFGRQQDAHEALRAVCSDRTVVSDSDNGETIDIRSPMEVFEGSFKTIIKCRTCNNTAERVETFQDLTINAAKQTSLVHGLHRLTRIEKLEDEDAYFCQHCQSFQPGMRQTLINKLPDVLVFHISRFSMTGEKILATIPAPLHMSMTPWTVDNFGLTPDISKPPTDCYSLVSAVLHFGQSPFSGHYTANTKLSNKQSSQWSRFVADLDPKEALTKDFIDSPWLSCDDERVSNFIWPPLWTDASQTPSVPSPNLLFYCKTS